ARTREKDMHVQRQIDQLLAQRAAEWLDALKNGDEKARVAFAAWLRQSKLHVEQYLEMVAIDQELQRLEPAQGEDVDALLARIAPNVIAIDLSRAGRAQESSTAARSQKRWRLGGALAAGIALCVVATQWYLAEPHHVTTSIGEQRTVALADG